MVNLTCYIILLFKCKEKIIIIRGKKIVKVSQPYSFLRSPTSKSLLLSFEFYTSLLNLVFVLFFFWEGGGRGLGCHLSLVNLVWGKEEYREGKVTLKFGGWICSSHLTYFYVVIFLLFFFCAGCRLIRLRDRLISYRQWRFTQQF